MTLSISSLSLNFGRPEIPIESLLLSSTVVPLVFTDCQVRLHHPCLSSFTYSSGWKLAAPKKSDSSNPSKYWALALISYLFKVIKFVLRWVKEVITKWSEYWSDGYEVPCSSPVIGTDFSSLVRWSIGVCDMTLKRWHYEHTFTPACAGANHQKAH